MTTAIADAGAKGLAKVELRPPHALIVEKTRPRRPDQIQPDVLASINACCSAKSRWPLTFLGGVGTGKTCAALCLVDQSGGRYTTLDKFRDETIDAQQGRLYNETGFLVTYNEIWRAVDSAGLYVLDEIGAREKVSDHHYEVLKRFLDIRDGKPTVYISNLTLERIAAVYDDRIASRLQDGTLVEFKGEDRRMTHEEIPF